jgi:hypothetical protein
MSKIWKYIKEKRGKKVPKDVLERIFGDKYDPNYNYRTGQTNK